MVEELPGLMPQVLRHDDVSLLRAEEAGRPNRLAACPRRLANNESYCVQLIYRSPAWPTVAITTSYVSATAWTARSNSPSRDGLTPGILGPTPDDVG